MKIIDSKQDKGLCVAYRCQRAHTKRDRFCSKHSKRYQKLTNYINYTFHALKCNAKRRGKPFFLTLEEFKQFCHDTGYMDKKGKNKSSLTIDRIDSSKGYQLGNIQILTLSENSKKSNGDCPF